TEPLRAVDEVGDWRHRPGREVVCDEAVVTGLGDVGWGTGLNRREQLLVQRVLIAREDELDLDFVLGLVELIAHLLQLGAQNAGVPVPEGDCRLARAGARGGGRRLHGRGRSWRRGGRGLRGGDRRRWRARGPWRRGRCRRGAGRGWRRRARRESRHRRGCADQAENATTTDRFRPEHLLLLPSVLAFDGAGNSSPERLNRILRKASEAVNIK